jgi:hypothetical protein
MNETILSVLLAGMLVFSAGPTFAQGQQRIPQPIIVNGQQTEGVTVVQNGTAQAFSCPSPQPYTTADGSFSGWACFDQNTGTWLMNALPQSTGAYPEESPGYDYGYQDVTPYYPYDDYPYGFYGGPEFGVFGFGRDRDFHERHGEERQKPERGGFERGRGGFEHGGGGFEHGGGGGHVGGGGGHVGGGGGHAGGGGGGHR